MMRRVAAAIGVILVVGSFGTTTTTPVQWSVVRAFDTTAVILDQAWFDARYAQGFRLYILHSTKWGTGEPWWRTEAQTQMALNAGLRVAGYSRDPSFWQEGIRAFGPYADDLEFFSLDIEVHPGVPATRAMVNGIATMGVQPVIYSGCDRGCDVGEPGRQHAEPTSRALRRVEHSDEQADRSAAKFRDGDRRHTCRPQHVHPRLTSGDVGCRGDGSLELVLMVETSLAGAATEVVPFGEVEVGRDRPGE